jgi:hypothetical protein
MTPQRIILVVAGVAAAVALFLLVRPDGDDEEAAPTTSARVTTSVAETTVPATTTAETTAPPTPQQKTVRVTVRSGAPVGGVQQIAARKGERVRIVVRSDVADHVHLHGYDLMLDVGPGAPAHLVFTADLTGVFELELEDRKLLIAEVEVTP